VSECAFEVIEAGLVPYQAALEWQRELARARIEGRLEHDVLLLLEHPSVVTVGRGARGMPLPDAGGLDVVEVERGGDVTYHGPGQLIGYPIFDLRRHRADLHWYLRTLEQALIVALAEFAISAERRAGYTGVWTRGRKIASIGVHVKQWVTWHGFALNVSTDLSQFQRIVPCGIRGVEMTSVQREEGRGKREEGDEGRGTGDGWVWDEAIGAVVKGFENAFGVTARRSVLRDKVS
jgi:lipoyl(octanoyl) transferase